MPLSSSVRVLTNLLEINRHFECASVEVAIHNILYARQVYPAELFVRRKKYNTPVFQSRHPALNEYISGAVKAAGEEITLVRTSIPSLTNPTLSVLGDCG